MDERGAANPATQPATVLAARHTPRPIGAKDNSPGQRPGNPAKQNPFSPEGAEEVELPEGWQSRLIASLIDETTSGDWGEARPDAGLIECRVLRGTDFRRATDGDVSEAPIRHVRQSSVDKRQLRTDDLLVELSGGSDKQPTGRMLHISERVLQHADKPALYSNFVKRLRVHLDSVGPEFFSIYWSWLWENGKTRIYQKRTTGIWNFRLSDFAENERVALPPPPEQRAIAGVLRTVQRAKEACEQVLAATRQLKQSLLHHLFTYGPVPFPQADHVDLRTTDFGDVPASWPACALSGCAHVQTGVAKGRDLEGSEVVELPYLRVANVQDGRLDLTEMKTIQLRQREVTRFLLQPGDVVLTEGGDFDKLGRGFIWHGQLSPCVHQNHIFAVRANTSKLLPEFLSYLAQSSYGKAYFLSVAHKTTNLACINTAKLKALPVLLPPLSEQRETAGQLSAVDAKLAALASRRAALAALFNSLLHHLLTARLRLPEFAQNTAGHRSVFACSQNRSQVPP